MISTLFVRVATRTMWRQITKNIPGERPLADHLHAAVDWLALAQDQTGNGGVSAGFGRQGWRPDYPETTGYIIPTFLAYHRLSGELSYRQRAIRMGDYELDQQAASGAVLGGYARPRSPQVFDTGQVTLGWIALYRETRTREYLDAATRAGDWLLSVQAGNGSWPSEEWAGAARSYHSRVSWGLVELGGACGDVRFLDAARRQLEWTLHQQQLNGWFAEAELRPHKYPVTHTIAYVMRGLLESGVELRESRYVAAARKTADALLSLQREDGSLSGLYDRAWSPRASWRCLTGCAQVAGIWLRLYELTRAPKYLHAGRKANAFLRRTQDLDTDGPSRGAIAGSLPFHGRYERFSYPNWATKFFADALMLECSLRENP